MAHTSHVHALSRANVFSASECGEFTQRIKALERDWILRSSDPAGSCFATLGAASYLDASPRNGGDPTRYSSLAQRYNPLLADYFSDLYPHVFSILAQTLGEPVQLAGELAIPGFHIFRGLAIPTQMQQASAHLDVQYVSVKKLPGGVRASDGFISFTLALELPKTGGGLNVWNVTRDDVAMVLLREGGTLADALRGHEPELCAYEVGALVVHSGHVVHQIAGVPSVSALDLRLTLQGHGFRQDGRWNLYW